MSKKKHTAQDEGHRRVIVKSNADKKRKHKAGGKQVKYR